MKKENISILIIDDERGSRELISLALEDAGYSTVKAPKPAEGLEMASALLPHLIVLDWHMPQMDGLQVLKNLKEQKTTKEIPVIMATGFKTESEYLKQALDLGAVDFIRKPIDDIELIARVKAALRLVHYYNESRDRLKTIHRHEKESMKQKAEYYKRELTRKKRELISNGMRLLQSMENTGAMMEELKNLDKSLAGDDGERLHRIVAKYQTKSFQTEWDEFERQFEEINSDFYRKLIREFPFLSAHERKLCVYFKMGIDNKDIAALTISGYDAVRKARQRLKKKFGLKPKAELTEFLNR